MKLAQRGLIVENASEKKKKEKKSVAKDTQAGRSTVIGCANACLFWQTNTQINSTACAFGRIYSSAPQFPYFTK